MSAASGDRRTEREGMLRLVQELAPRGRLVGMRRLRGGLGARMHVLRIESASGERSNVVLRRSRIGTGGNPDQPAKVRKEFELLSLLQKAGVPAAEPILADADGFFLGVPALVLTYLEGRSLYEPRDPQAWCHQLADVLLRIQAIGPDNYDLTFLPLYDRNRLQETIAEQKEKAVLSGEPLALQAAARLEAALPGLDLLPPVLVHEDFWPGNTVWRRGKLTGVVDWASACVGDPRIDIAQCRADIVVSHGIELADRFLAAYETLRGAAMPGLWFFDLMRGLLALLHYEHWLRGYHDAGLTHLQPEAVGERLRAFLREGLSRA